MHDILHVKSHKAVRLTGDGSGAVNAFKSFAFSLKFTPATVSSDTSSGRVTVASPNKSSPIWSSAASNPCVTISVTTAVVSYDNTTAADATGSGGADGLDIVT